VADRSRRPEIRDEPRRRREFHFGVGSASAALRLLGAALLTALVVVAIARHWPWYVLLVIGVIWAGVFALGVVVPLISSFIADSLSQFGRARPVHPREPDPEPADAWGDQAKHPMRRASDIGLGPSDRPYAPPTKGMMARPYIGGSAPGFDWVGLLQGVGARLEDALGEGFTAEAEGGTSLMLRHGGEMSRKVNLGLIFQPPPLDVGERALRGVLKMMDEAQMFAMRVHHEPWPSRGGTREAGPGNLPRPQVRLEGGEIRMSWADSLGTMLRLRPLPFESAPPKARPGMGGDRSW
jgi:hypothetical protein